MNGFQIKTAWLLVATLSLLCLAIAHVELVESKVTSFIDETNTAQVYSLIANGDTILEQSDSHGNTTTRHYSAERRLGGSMDFRKFSVVVGYANDLYIPDRGNGELQGGDLYVADEYVYNTKQNDLIGRMYQRCVALPSATAAPVSLWECLWEFELQLRSSQPGKLQVQGTWINDGTSTPGSIGFPDKQFYGIVGGTGAFTSVFGVARMMVLNFNAIPPTYCYTFYVKLG